MLQQNKPEVPGYACGFRQREGFHPQPVSLNGSNQ